MATLYDAQGNPVEVPDSLFQQEQDEQPQTNEEWGALRKANKETKTEREGRESAEKALAFYKAGIDPDAPGMTQYFVKAYDGEVTPEKIREAAAAAGIIQAPEQTPEAIAAAQAQQEALGSQGRIADAAGSGMAAPTAEAADRAALTEALSKGGLDGLAGALSAMGIPQATV